MTRALIIGAAERLAISKLQLLAAATPFDVKAVLALDPAAVRDMMEAYTIVIPRGYHVTYSHEQQPPGLCHHLSVSVDTDYKMPHTAAVEMILQAFGMQPIAKSLKIWLEEVSPGLGAVSILQLVTQ
jgi:hypothetical protein